MAVSPQAWRLGAPERKVLRLRVNKTKSTTRAHPALPAPAVPGVRKPKAPRQCSDRGRPEVWKWALAPGKATRVHMHFGDESFEFPCMRSKADPVAAGCGENEHEQATAVVAAFGRQFCDKCWRRLPQQALLGLEALVKP